MQRLNMTVLRTWAFNDGAGWQALQTCPGVYDERVFRCATRHCGSNTPERLRQYQLLRLPTGILFQFAQRSDPIDTRQQDMQLYCLIPRVYTPGAGLRPKSAFAKLQLRKALVTYEPFEFVGLPPLQPGAGLGHRAGAAAQPAPRPDAHRPVPRLRRSAAVRQLDRRLFHECVLRFKKVEMNNTLWCLLSCIQ